ncbi:hypothetical protein [Paucibacter soli]|uniref:hypothetical protein n=1 Tax=Paucibacter soli TaxID=3133433 RepID=UPI0030A6D4AA
MALLNKQARSLLVMLLAMGCIPIVPAQPSGGRLRPPEAVPCPRDQLTLFSGVVQKYRRAAGHTVLRIRTDAGTTEVLTVKHPATAPVSSWFLMEGRKFEPQDWARIEQSPGRLRAGMRAAAWVCGSDGSNPIIDWNPPREP